MSQFLPDPQNDGGRICTLTVSSSTAPTMHRASFRAARSRRVETNRLGIGFCKELKVEDGEFWEVISEGGKERVGE